MVLGPDNPHSSIKALLSIVVLHQIKHILSLKMYYLFILQRTDV